MRYNRMELMISVASRFLEDDSTVVVGTGAPCAAAMLAQLLHAPNLITMFEAGGVGPILPAMPVSVGDSRTFHRGLVACSMTEIMEACQRGVVDYAFIGGAQIDAYGNVNSTVIGDDYHHPKVRLPGSGGANDLASLCWRTLVISPHDRRRFTDKIDFVTTPGYLDGPGAREAAGLPPDCGPYKVITDLCVMGFDSAEKRMVVESIHPGITRMQVEDATGFSLVWSDQLSTTDPVVDHELRMLRERVDPQGFIIGRH